MSCKKILLKDQNGISMVEFLIGFPLFLLSTLMVLEIAYMNADSHLVELAAFDATRVLSANQYDDMPCGPEAMNAARETVTRRLAATSGSVEQVGLMLDLPDLGKSYLDLITAGNFKSVVETNLRRLPMSEVSSRITCSYNATTDNITVDVDYYRQPKFPIVGKTLFQIFSMAEFLEQGRGITGMIKYLEELTNTAPLDANNLFTPYAVMDDPSKFENLKLEYGKVVNDWKMKTREILAKITSELNDSATEEEKLEYIVSNLPDIYKKIPINSSLTLKRKLNRSGSIQDVNGTTRKPWHGKIQGLINIDGEFNTWAKDLSVEKDQDLKDGVRL